MNDSILQQKKQIEELLGGARGVGVVLSSHQSLDSVAAALSMFFILQDSGKSSQIVSPKEPIVEYSSLVGIDQIGTNFTGSTKTLTVSFPYKDGEIEKVSYNIEGDKLNVNLFAETQGITFTEKDIRYIRQGSAPSVVVTIGVSDHSELQGLIDPASTKIINIDNNILNSLYGDVVLVDASFSSISEIVAKLSEIMNLQVEFDVAQNLLDGLMSATQNFTSPKTSPLAFEMAGVLMQKGAVRKMQKIENRSQDTSLQMLGNKPQGQNFPKQSFQNAQDKPFDQSPFGDAPFDQSQGGQGKQGKQFGGQKPQQKQFGQQQPQNKPYSQNPGKQFGGQNFPKQNPFKKQTFSGAPLDSTLNNQPNPFPQQFEDQDQDSFQQQPQFQPRTQDFNAPQNNVNMNQDNRMEEIKNQLQSMPTPDAFEDSQPQEAQIPPEDQAPSDWFTPKVFKSNKN